MTDEKSYESDGWSTYYVVPVISRGGRLDRKQENKWTIDRLWHEYQSANPDLKGMSVYRAIYNAHLSKPFGEMEPAAISAFDLDRLRLENMKGKSAKTVANALELLRRIVNFGVRRQLCEGPGFAIQLPRVNNLKTEDLAPGELARLVSVLDKHLKEGSSCGSGAAIMKLVLFTGMRRGELFRLECSDLDFYRGNIRLREPKGGRDAIIPMSSRARALLKGLPGAGSKYVFPGRNGGQRRDVRGQVNLIRAEARLPDGFRPLHGLRHVFASGLISSGVEFQIVQRLLTHSGGTVTHRYAHIRDDALRAAAELAGRLVEEAGEKIT